MAATGTTRAKPPSVEAIFEARTVVLVGPASGRPSSTWTRAMTTRGAGGRCAAVGSPHGSPGVAWSQATGWAATAG